MPMMLPTRSLVVLLLIIIALAGAVPVSAVKSVEQSFDDSLTRGSKFTVTITGKPNTSYYVWIPHTFSMTGEQYDQPPVLIDSTLGMSKDSEGGPYTIGSYQYYNGNGRTIQDDIAPSTATMSNTNYYGLVRTESDGQAVVEFTTSVYTGLRSYSVKVENPDSVDNDQLGVVITLQSRKVPMSIYTVSTTRATRQTTRTIVTTPPTTVPAPQTTEEILLPTQLPAAPAPLPTTKANMGIMTGVCALAGVLLLAGTRQK